MGWPVTGLQILLVDHADKQGHFLQVDWQIKIMKESEISTKKFRKIKRNAKISELRPGLCVDWGWRGTQLIRPSADGWEKVSPSNAGLRFYLRRGSCIGSKNLTSASSWKHTISPWFCGDTKTFCLSIFLLLTQSLVIFINILFIYLFIINNSELIY